ncbi:MAG: hypothetical protein ABR613_11125 [Actinomycetota bacterium]
MRTRRLPTAVVVTGAIGVIGWASVALSSGASTNTNVGRQAFKTLPDPVVLTSTEYTRVDGLDGLTLTNARGGVTASVSVNVTGGAVDIRVRIGNDGPLLNPENARFDALEGGGAFSFTFVRPVIPPCAVLTVEARSADGAAVTLEDGNLTALFRRLKPDRGCV